MTECNPLPDCLSHLAQRDAALRAEGFAEARDAAWTLADRTWPEAHDLLDAIAALKPGDAAPPLPTNESYFDLVNTPVKPGDGR